MFDEEMLSMLSFDQWTAFTPGGINLGLADDSNSNGVYHTNTMKRAEPVTIWSADNSALCGLNLDETERATNPLHLV